MDVSRDFLCVENKTKRYELSKMAASQSDAASFNSKFLNPIQSIYPEPGDHSINPDVTLERQTNAIFGVAFVLLSGTRAACFPRIDADATDVYRFPWTRDRARVEFELSQEITKVLKFSRK